MGNEQSTLAGEHPNAPAPLTEEQKEAKAQRRAAELEQIRRENLRKRREAAEQKDAEKKRLEEQVAQKQVAQKEASEKARLYIEKEKKKQEDARRLDLEDKHAKLQAKVELIQSHLAAQLRRPPPPPHPAATTASSHPDEGLPNGLGGDVPGQGRSESVVGRREFQPPTLPRAATNAATNALPAPSGDVGNKSPPTAPTSLIPPREPAWRAAPPPQSSIRPAQSEAGTSLPNRGRNDESFPRRLSNDSGVELAQPTRAIKVPTGPRRVSNDDGRGMAPPQTNPGVKRPAASSTSNGNAFSDLNVTPKRQRTSVSSSASPISPTTASTQAVERHERQPPEWYKRLSVVTKRGGNDADVEPLLKALKMKIKHCKTHPDQAASVFNDIRSRLHTLPFQSVNERVLRNNLMLSNEGGLPQLFDSRYSGGVKWPFDIKADAKELYNKWYSRIFETDLLRGIIPGGGKSVSSDRSSDKLDPSWPKRAFNKFGHNYLVNGQWWPTQLAALRDGAVGSAQAGISGRVTDGAWSCTMSGGHDYADVDMGEEVQYCGTDSYDGKITPSTKLMIESYKNGHPVRLLRSHNLPSPWAPSMGFRYDGLYDIKSYERLDPEHSIRQRHRFHLVRQAGQDPIRGTGPERRPTQQEIEAHQKDKRLRGVSGGGNVKGKKGTVFPTWG